LQTAPTTSPIDNWRDFWSAPLAHEFQTEDSWKLNAELFVERSHAILGYRPDDVVLDVGSGPGATAELLRRRVAEVHCAEVSRTFVDAARARFVDAPNVVLHELGEDYTDLSFLAPRRFSLVLCNNVVQYYRSVEEVERLILAVKAIAAPGARLLIGEILTDSGVAVRYFRDSLRAARRERYLGLLVSGFLQLAKIRYMKYRNAFRTLELPVSALEGIVRRLDLRAEILDTQLSFFPHRVHLLVHF
jgi:SAM-dependent methyltransferase